MKDASPRSLAKLAAKARVCVYVCSCRLGRVRVSEIYMQSLSEPKSLRDSLSSGWEFSDVLKSKLACAQDKTHTNAGAYREHKTQRSSL